MEQCQDLKLMARGNVEPGSLERDLGRRVLTLADDLRSTKLSLLQVRRQSNLLREENRHLEVRSQKP